MLNTKAKVIYNVMKNVEAKRQLLGHASVAATSAYLGIEQDKLLDIAKNHKMFWNPSVCDRFWIKPNQNFYLIGSN